MTTNALHLPWVPVQRNGVTTLVSLRDALANAHLYDGLGDALAPVEKEGLLRFLTSVGAVVLRNADNLRASVRERRIPGDAVSRLVAQHGHLFDLRDPDRPFLQEWHAQATAVDDKNARPVRQLHVHVPGGSSSQWCLRHEPRDSTDPAVLAILLVTTWFHGKPSNGGRPAFYADKSIAGSPSGGAWDTAFHLVGKTLAETLLANTLTDWVDVDQTLPAWLDQDSVPDMGVLIHDPRGLWRTTWTPNRPLVLWSDEAPDSYVIGLTARPVPLVGGAEDAKTAAKAMHVDDYAHLWYNKATDDKDPEIKAAFAPVRLLSTEGAHNWYSKNLDRHLALWGNDRLVGKSNGIRVGFHNERGDTYGTRVTSEWVEVALDRLTLGGEERDTFFALLAFAHDVRMKFAAPLLRASDVKTDRKMRSALVDAAQRDFYSAIDPITLGALADATSRAIDVIAGCQRIAEKAEDTFRAHTTALATPSTFFRVEEARARFSKQVHILLTKAIEPHKLTSTTAPTPQETSA